MLKKLTPEQQRLKFQIRKKWTGKIYQSDFLNREKSIELTKWLYSICKLPQPKVFVLKSPLACQIAANYVWLLRKKKLVGNEVWNEVENEVWNEVGNEVENEVWNEVENEVWDEVGNEVENEVWNEVGNEVENEVGNEVENEVWDEVRNEVWNEVENEVWDEVGNEVENEVGNEVRNEVENEVENEVGKKKKIVYFPTCRYGDIYDYGWMSFLDFFDEVGVLNKRKFQNFRKYRDYLETGIFYAIQCRDMCFLCGMPTFIKKDEAGRMHCADGMAIKWKDGYGQYYLHGVPFEEKEIEALKSGKLTALDIMNEENQDKKRALAMTYGNERMVRELKAKEKSKETDNQGNTMRILEIEDKNDPDRCIVIYEAVCPSKNEKIYLRVPPSLKDERPLIAKLWTFKPAWEHYHETGEIPEFIKET